MGHVRTYPISLLVLPPKDHLQEVRDSVKNTYNLRTTATSFQVAQEVFHRNFAQSSFERGFNAKLAKKFIKCRIARKIGSALYEVEDMHGKKIAVSHAKDLKR